MDAIGYSDIATTRRSGDAQEDSSLDAAATAEVVVPPVQPDEDAPTIENVNFEASLVLYIARMLEKAPDFRTIEFGEKMEIALALVRHFQSLRIIDLHERENIESVAENFREALKYYLYECWEQLSNKEIFIPYLEPLRKILFPLLPAQRRLLVPASYHIDQIREAIAMELRLHQIPLRKARFTGIEGKDRQTLLKQGYVSKPEDGIRMFKDGLMLFPVPVEPDVGDGEEELARVIEHNETMAIYTLPEHAIILTRKDAKKALGLVLDFTM